MDNNAIKDFEELEGLSDVTVIDIELDDTAGPDDDLKPPNASTLPIADVIYEMERRGLKGTGFDSDREKLQEVFDQEFAQAQEAMKAQVRGETIWFSLAYM